MKTFIHITHIFIALLLWCNVAYVSAGRYDDYVREIKIDDSSRTVTVVMDEAVTQEKFTEKSIRKIYKQTTKGVHKALPKEYRKYEVRIYVNGLPIESLLETVGAQEKQEREETYNIKKREKHRGGWWANIVYDGQPWTTNISRPVQPVAALNGKHISLWQSHGRYYDGAKGFWKWQRPLLFSTTEDLFTQTIVVPYLIPMLENSGAVVFTPRERDWQTEEIIIDNGSGGYQETNGSTPWTTSAVRGFAMPQGDIYDNYNPFEAGTVRQTNAARGNNAGQATYQPTIRKSGRYAVYVSYATLPGSSDAVVYSVVHQGIRTNIVVNQQMGGGTWVYLGTFNFDAGNSDQNRVVVSANTSSKGIVTTDAVRFGGGMGNISRGGTTSGFPRCLEGARYYAQWAGAPYNVYGGYAGEDDYKDDINVRSLMTNWLSKGSPYNPATTPEEQAEGKKVPIDLALAIHSDAGFNPDMKSIHGSLAISTTDYNDGKLAAGPSRQHSTALAKALLDDSKRDITRLYGDWNWRYLWDRNYSETRLPAVPSAIFETMSHQSFPDMRMGQDPNFKFNLARSIYKTLLRFEANAHGEKAIVHPLPPHGFHIMLTKDGRADLGWMPQKDELEPTATPTSYNVYTSMGAMGFDNGTNTSHTFHSVRLVPDLLYRFRITAVNAGGESFPTEELCVIWHNEDAPTILIINGFQRLSSPTIVRTDSVGGCTFNLADDPGLTYGLTAGWAGQDGTMAGHFISGNTFDYVTEHARALLSANRYNVVSTTKSIVEWGGYNLTDFDAVDLLLGNERDDHHSLKPYKTFSTSLQKRLLDYQRGGRGALLVSGSYIAQDMQEPQEASFLEKLLHLQWGGPIRQYNYSATGLQQTFSLTNTLNAEHYATVQSDILMPIGSAFVAMQYADRRPAAVAWDSGFRTFTMGFPFECINSPSQRELIMQGIMAFLVR